MVIKVYVDTDVVISSFLSQKGAAYILLNSSRGIKLYISNISLLEIERVAKRLGIEPEKVKDFRNERFGIVKLTKASKIPTKFSDYVLDSNDAHILAGADKAEVRFLISYNLKDFKISEIKKRFNIIVTTPANLLQYLRSQ